MIRGETLKGKQWLLDNIEKGTFKMGDELILTRSMDIEDLPDVRQLMIKAGLTVDD